MLVNKSNGRSVLNITSCLLSLAAKHMCNDKGMGPERAFIDFICDIDPKNTWKVGYRTQQSSLFFRKDSKLEYDFEYAVAYKCLSVLALTKVCDIPKGLDEADPTILPLADKE
jgi:hypothetical protein